MSIQRDNRLPKLNATTAQLYTLYHTRQIVNTGELARILGVSQSTASKAIKSIGKLPCTCGVNIRVTELFDAYGWDISKINKSMERLEKLGVG